MTGDIGPHLVYWPKLVYRRSTRTGAKIGGGELALDEEGGARSMGRELGWLIERWAAAGPRRSWGPGPAEPPDQSFS